MENSQQESVIVFPLWRNSRNSECGLLLFCITLQQKILEPPWPIAGKNEWLFETFSFLGLQNYLNTCCHLQKHWKKKKKKGREWLFETVSLCGLKYYLNTCQLQKHGKKKKREKKVVIKNICSRQCKILKKKKKIQFYTFKLQNYLC